MTGGTWIVLGASSAIARAFAHEVAAKGCDVVLAGRGVDDLKRTSADISIRHGVKAMTLAFDAADTKSHTSFVAACRTAAKGPINIFLAFGLMPEQDEIDAAPERGLDAIAATYTGVVSVLHRFAPLLEEQGAGHVIVLGSVAGDRGRIKNYVYGSAKAGVHAYVQGLRARLFRSGVTVTTIKPGFIDTAMTWGLPGLFLVASPEACAAACLRYAGKGAETRYYPPFWLLIMSIIKSIPERIFKRLSI